MRQIYSPNSSEFPIQTDAVVIGGGIFGMVISYFLSKKGLKTIVLEKQKTLGSLSTAAASDAFRAQFTLPENIELMKSSIAMLENFAELINKPGYDIGLRHGGYIMLSSNENAPELLNKRVEHQHLLGLTDVEFLDGDEVRHRFPFYAPEVKAATFRASDGWFSAHEVIYGLAKASTVKCLTEVNVTQIVSSGSQVTGVNTDKGVVEAKYVILAAGAFSTGIAKTVGLDLPIALSTQQEATIHHHDLIPSEAPITIDLDTAAFWRPESGGGAMLSDGSHVPSPKPMNKVSTDWRYPAYAMEAVSRLSPFWMDVAETISSEHLSVSAGQLCFSPDKKPIFGASGIDGLYLSVGCSGYGVMASMEIGHRMAEMITGTYLGENPFRLQRFYDGSELRQEGMIFMNNHQ